MTQLYIRLLTLSNFGAFRGDHELRFSKGLNVITGANGAGKTTIFHALKAGLGVGLSNNEKELIAVYRRQFGTDHAEGSNFKIEIEGTVPEDKKWKALATLDGEGVPKTDFIQLMFANASTATDEVISLPFRGPIPDFLKRKFGVSGDVVCRLTRDGTVTFSIENTRHKRLSSFLWSHAATGERALTAFAMFLQAREMLATSIPLILDSPLGSLDREPTKVFVETVQSLACQVILLESPIAMGPASSGGRRYVISQTTPEGHSSVQLVEDVSEHAHGERQ